MDETTKNDPKRAVPASRKPYETPSLVTHGSLAQITKTLLSGKTDNGPSNQKC